MSFFLMSNGMNREVVAARLGSQWGVTAEAVREGEESSGRFTGMGEGVA